MNVNIERKRKYIKIVSDIMEKEGIDGLSIRRIAKEAGCTSAVLSQVLKQKRRSPYK